MPNPGSASVPAAESRRVRARGARTCSRSTSTSTACCRADTISNGFDNVADSQAFSPTLMEGYLRAASQGDGAGDRRSRRARRPKRTTACRRPRRSCAASTARRSARAAASRSPHTFPADGDYVFTHRAARQRRRLPVRRPGRRRADRRVDRRRAQGAARRSIRTWRRSRPACSLKTPPIHVTAGPQRVDRGVHPALRRTGQRSDRADRSHAGRHADRRRLRHHHAAAPQGPQRSSDRSTSPASRRRRAGARIFSCRPTTAGRRGRLRHARSSRGSRRRRSAVPSARRTSTR